MVSVPVVPHWLRFPMVKNHALGVDEPIASHNHLHRPKEAYDSTHYAKIMRITKANGIKFRQTCEEQ